MINAHRTVIAASLIGLGLTSGNASAQPVPIITPLPRPRPSSGRIGIPGLLIVPPNRPDLAVPAIPVPHVMNGGGCGLTGYDYYNDSIARAASAPAGARAEYVLAPALIAPLPGR